MWQVAIRAISDAALPTNDRCCAAAVTLEPSELFLTYTVREHEAHPPHVVLAFVTVYDVASHLLTADSSAYVRPPQGRKDI